jgi:RHS repeat-associated protein
VTNANGHWVEFGHDSRGYVVAVTPQAGPALAMGRDVLGYVNRVTLPGPEGNRTITLTNDEDGRVTAVVWPDGSRESFVYNADGNLVSAVDTAGRTSRWSYLLGDLASASRELDGQEVAIRLDWDQQMNLLRVRDPLNRNVETYYLDAAARVTNVVNLETQTLEIAYGAPGYVSRLKRFDGSVVSNAFDAQGNLAAVHSGAFVDRFTYYANDLLRTASNEAGIVSNAYDGANRLTLTQVSGPIPQPSLAYSLDLAGNVTNAAASSIQYQASYTHDAAERLTSLQFPVSSFQFQYATHNGLVSCVSNAESGLRVEYTYDVLDRPASIVWRKPDGSVVRSFGYGYNAAGMITNVARESAAESAAYGYDGLDRLTSAVSSNLAASYSWDLAGNPVQRVENGNTTDYTMGVGDRLASWTGGGSLFDAAGCVTSITRGADTLGLAWNGRYQLTEAWTNGAAADRFGYDALGRRAWTASDGPHVIADLDATGGVVRSYVYGPGTDNILAMVVPAGGTASVPSVFYYVKDHLGTVHALVDASGSVVECYRYDPWGRVLGVWDASGIQQPASSIGNRYLFQGREFSWATGLYYFRARWYDPRAGRWLSNDPIGISGGLNQYVFCGGRPVVCTDPYGLADVIMSRKAFWDAMDAAYLDVRYNTSQDKIPGEGVPLFGTLLRLAHLDMDEFVGRVGMNKDVYFLDLPDSCGHVMRIRLGLGEEVNYAKIGMWDALYNPVPGSSMWVWKLAHGWWPSEGTRFWYRFGRTYAVGRFDLSVSGRRK